MTRSGGPGVPDVVDIAEPEAGPGQQLYDVPPAGVTTPPATSAEPGYQTGRASSGPEVGFWETPDPEPRPHMSWKRTAASSFSSSIAEVT